MDVPYSERSISVMQSMIDAEDQDDCKTEWSSTFDMLKRFLKIRVSAVKALADVDSNIQFSGLELQCLAIVCSALKLVKQTLLLLCRRDTDLLTSLVSLSA